MTRLNARQAKREREGQSELVWFCLLPDSRKGRSLVCCCIMHISTDVLSNFFFKKKRKTKKNLTAVADLSNMKLFKRIKTIEHFRRGLRFFVELGERLTLSDILLTYFD
jgi:hypothetical protein